MRKRLKTVLKRVFDRLGTSAGGGPRALPDKAPESESKNGSFSAGIHFEALEPRLLLSATVESAAVGAAIPTPQPLAPLAIGADHFEFASQNNALATDLLRSSEPRQDAWSTGPEPPVDLIGNEQLPGQNTSATNSVNAVSADFETGPAATSTLETVDILANADAQILYAINARQELVIVDGGIANYEQLVTDLLSDRDDGRQFEVVILDPERDGVSQISDLLADRQNLDAVHFVSHGNEQGIKLGVSWIDSNTLKDYSSSVAEWKNALISGADLLFYGCNLAAGESGRTLMQSFSDLTGADVAASDDLTGYAISGGDWDLEHSVGEVEIHLVFDGVSWQGVLAEFTVDSNADTVDANPGDGNAKDASNNTSLRAAIMEANALGGADKIILPADTYTLSISGAWDDTNATGDLDITQDLTIEGEGAATTTINGGALDRVLHILSSATVKISGVTITNGDILDDGGGISNAGDLTLIDVEITGNIGVNGGGLYSTGTAELNRVTISGNEGEIGGGIYTNGSSLTATNTTVSGNSATFKEAGGIYVWNPVRIINSTIAYNSATGGYPGGIFVKSDSADLVNTILASNTGGNGSGTINGSTDSISTDTISGLTQLTEAQLNLDPTLKNNGGSTNTHALLAGSLAIDAGTTTGAPTIDQRGYTRDASPDVGAYEVDGSPLGGLWLTTKQDVTSSGALKGLASWEDGDVLQLGDPDLMLESPTTDGTIALAFNIDQFAEEADGAEIDAIHYVTKDITVGSITTMDLFAGDIIFSTADLEDNGGVAFRSTNTIGRVEDSDLVVFRPDTPGDYSSGTFHMLIDEGTITGGNDWLNLRGVSLVEKDTLVGDKTLTAGTLILAEGAATEGKKIQLFTPTHVGATSNGTLELLLNIGAAGVGLSDPMNGLELIEEATTVGGANLSVGNILIALEGSTNLSYLDVNATEFGSGSDAVVDLLMDGADVGLTTTAENVFSLTLVPAASAPANNAPVITDGPDTAGLAETDAALTSTGTLTVSDADTADTVTASVDSLVVSGTSDRLDPAAPTDGELLAMFSVTPTAILDGTQTTNTLTWDFNSGTETFDYLATGETLILTYTIKADDTAASDTETVTITITGTNDAATVSAATEALAETDVPVTASGTLTSTDPDNVDNTFTADTIVGTIGTFTIDAAGAWTFTANSAYDNLNVGDNVNETFNVTSVDGTASTVAITINGTNDGPVANVDSGTTAEDSTLSVAAGAGVLTNDTDLDGITLTVSEVNGNAGDVGTQITLGSGALLTLDSDGSYDYDPNGQFENLAVGASTTDSFAYTVSDGQGGTDTATVTITITGTNDAPVAVDDANTTSEDTPISSVLTLQANDTDIDGDSLSVDVSSVGTFATTQGGTIVVAVDGHYTYTPAAAFTGIDTFDYTVTDGTLTDTGTLSISVGATNDDPVATDDTGAVDEDATLTVAAINGVIQANDTDPDGDTLTVGAIRTGTEAGSGTAGTLGSPLTGTYGTLTLNADGSYTYVADQAAADALASGVTATDTFTYTASDGKGGTDAAEIVITVTGTNDLPVAADDPAAATNEETVLNSNVPAASDVDGTIASYALGTDVTEGALTFNADGSYSFDPGNDFDDLAVGATRAVTFTYTATDNDGGVSAPATVTITVTGTNDLPVAADDPAAGTNEETILNSNVPAASDVDGTIASYALGTDVTEGTLTFNADGSYSFDPGSDFDDLAVGATRAVTFTYTATDNDGGVSAPATVTITVTGTNDLVAATDPPPPPPIDDTDPDPITPPEPEPEPEPGPEEPPPTEEEEDASPDADDLIEEESDDNVTEIPATAAGTVSTQQRLVSNSLREFVQRTLQSVSLALDTDVELGGVGTASPETQPAWSVVPPRAASMALGTGLTELGIQTIRALDFLEDSLDGLKQEAENEMAFNQMAASSAIAVTTGLSIGYVAWLLRSGVLLSSLLSSMPAWRFLDPLPVLAGKFEDDEETDEESLETIIEQPGPTSADDAPEDAVDATDAKET